MKNIKILLALSWLAAISGLSAQGSFTIGSGSSVKINGTAHLKLNNTDWKNSGTLTAGEGDVELSGTLVGGTHVSGTSADIFHHLTIQHSTKAVLEKSISVEGSLSFSSGLLDLNGHDIVLHPLAGTLSGESENSRITAISNTGGEVRLTQALNAPAQANPGNLGVVITSAADLGETTISRGHQPQTNACYAGIQRYFIIEPTHNSGLNATLRCYYFDAELLGIAENDLTLYRSDDGGLTWTDAGFDSRNATENWVEKTGVNSFSRFSLGEKDIQKPTISGCPGNQSMNTAAGTCAKSYIIPFPALADNCGGLLTWGAAFSGNANGNPGPLTGLTNGAPSSNLSFNKGATTVTLSATDAVGNTSTLNCVFAVTVADAEKPTLAGCPTNILLKTNDDGGSDCAVTLNYTAPTFADNCDGTGAAVHSSGPASSTSLNVSGSPYTVVYTDTDLAGNAVATNCSFTVTVQDNTLPTITCPGSQALTTETNQCGTLPFSYSVTTTDNCSPTVSIVSGLPSGSTFPVGATTVVWKTTDTGGNMTTCQFVITVADDQAPSIVCPQNISKNTDPNLCTAVTTYANPTVSDNCTGWTLTRTSPPSTASGSAFPKNTTMATWKITDASGTEALCNFTVTVSDAQKPNITCPGNIVRNTDAGYCYAAVNYAAPTASDNCGTVTVALTSPANTASGSQFPKGMTTVAWEASDAASPANTKSCSFLVTVNDGQAPTIACPASQTKSTDPDKCYAVANYAPPTAADNCSGVGASLVGASLPSGSQFPKGISTVQWKATDAVGLTKTCTFRVTVNDAQAPVITCPQSISTGTDPNLCTAVETYANATFTDNCAGGSVVKISGLASGSAFPKGISTVTFKAADAVGLTKTCSFTVTVTDAQLPSITCPPSISVTAPPGQCSTTVAYTVPTATDNCAVQSKFLLSGLGSGSTFLQGVTTNVWRAIDNSGGSSTCAFTVTVACGAAPNPSQGGETAERDAASPPLRGGWEGLLRLVPNPATNEVQIWVEGSTSETLASTGGELTVFDALGRAVWQQTLDVEQTQISLYLNVASFASGVYQVCLRTNDGMATKSLLVSRL